VKSSGNLYFDDLTLYTKKVDDGNTNTIPQDIKLPDSAEKAVSVKSSKTSFQFMITGDIQAEKTILDKLYSQKLKDKINASELVAVTGKIDSAFSKITKKPIISTQGGPSTFVYKNSTFIVLDDSKNSIRQTNAAQWKWFENKLQSINTNNIFITLPVPINSFVDPYEAALFQKILTKYQKASNKNIWVISGGKVSKVDVEKGVRNISCTGMVKSSDITSTLDSTKYLLVSVVGNQITYQIKTLF